MQQDMIIINNSYYGSVLNFILALSSSAIDVAQCRAGSTDACCEVYAK